MAKLKGDEAPRQRSTCPGKENVAAKSVRATAPAARIPRASSRTTWCFYGWFKNQECSSKGQRVRLDRRQPSPRAHVCAAFSLAVRTYQVPSIPHQCLLRGVAWRLLRTPACCLAR